MPIKPKNEVTRSLIIDKDVWDEAMKYSKLRYKMSLSKVIEAHLKEWIKKERKKPLENENQGRFF